MREIPEALAAHLASDATTVCHGWRVTRRDGVVIGFTEHDRDLRFAGTDFLAASGFRASETEAAAGLAADAGEVTGGFSSAAISEADVTAGRYDGARVEQFLVNWQAPEQHMLLTVQDIGEVTRAGGAFRAELRSLTHRLGEVQGRSYGRRCDAAFGDARCGASLAGRRETGAIIEVAGDVGLRVSGLSAAVGAYRYGLIRMTSGANAGWTCDVEDHITRVGAGTDGAAGLTLWLPPPVPLSAGDTFIVTMGCDKSFATCRDRFANALNFRGFPHMPGSDFSYGYADGETVHDGRPLFA
ncbi:putative phage protein (TIGR02218 family) [Rhizobium sp. PP-F2F-G38]|nr:putative phage protein (TIGR02218 family) [Rhizobium sp. PP-WC-1G-195]PYE99479.1 putative phage protein (TIGR02218 family) [Rhizobium sp. PP-F2F-G38]